MTGRAGLALNRHSPRISPPVPMDISPRYTEHRYRGQRRKDGAAMHHTAIRFAAKPASAGAPNFEML
ncbi:MAG TPA: hypothetical protein VJ890_11320, partial [Vineibacter sp.]|nr:hypothetical protein [Vineibacter sp.]